MSNQIPVEDFRTALLGMLEEVFEQVHGFILDRGTSIFETLNGVSAGEASRTVSSQCASIAAQVNHVRFYLDTLNDVAKTGEFKKVDWASSWKVEAVTEAEWQEMIAGLRASYDVTREFAATFTGWNEQTIGGAIAIVSHSAYHLGEIRQALGLFRG